MPSGEISETYHPPNGFDAIICKLRFLVIPWLESHAAEVIVVGCGGSVVLCLHGALDRETAAALWYRQGWIVADNTPAEAQVLVDFRHAAAKPPVVALQCVQIFQSGENRVDAILLIADRIGGVGFPDDAST
jgi:hypothetical protein